MRLEYRYELNYPAAEVWSVISDFADLSWLKGDFDHVAVSGGGVGMTRTLSWKYLDHISVHRLEEYSNEAMYYRYSVPTSHVRLLENGEISNQVIALDDGNAELHIIIELADVEEHLRDDIAGVLQGWPDKIVEMLKLELDRLRGS